MKGTFRLNLKEEKAMDAEIAIILHPPTDAARITHTGFGEVGDISDLD